jgi:hypothetical protein
VHPLLDPDAPHRVYLIDFPHLGDCGVYKLVSPLAISCPNNRSTSRRSDGAPGDFIADLPLSAVIHPAGPPISTSTVGVLRRPVESARPGLSHLPQGSFKTKIAQCQ